MSLFEAFKQALKAVFKFDANNNLKTTIAGDEVNLAKESTLSSILSQLDIKLSELRDALKPTRTSPTQDLSGYSISAGEVAEITKSGLDGYSAVIVTVRATYDANATAGVRVRWLYSQDGTNFDTVGTAERLGNYEDLAFTAGGTEQGTIVVPIFTDNVKIQIVNLDSSYAVTVDAWTLLMR